MLWFRSFRILRVLVADFISLVKWYVKRLFINVMNVIQPQMCAKREALSARSRLRRKPKNLGRV